MSRPMNKKRPGELRNAIVQYLTEHGLNGLSVRPLQNARMHSSCSALPLRIEGKVRHSATSPANFYKAFLHDTIEDWLQLMTLDCSRPQTRGPSCGMVAALLRFDANYA
jgi:hypothetical protein